DGIRGDLVTGVQTCALPISSFQQWRGEEVDTQGDAFFVAFARASDAISAAVDAQCALASHCWPEGALVRVRMSLHTGEPQRSLEIGRASCRDRGFVGGVAG